MASAIAYATRVPSVAIAIPSQIGQASDDMSAKNDPTLIRFTHAISSRASGNEQQGVIAQQRKSPSLFRGGATIGQNTLERYVPFIALELGHYASPGLALGEDRCNPGCRRARLGREAEEGQ